MGVTIGERGVAVNAAASATCQRVTYPPRHQTANPSHRRLKVEKLRQANTRTAANSANDRRVSTCWQVQERGRFCSVRRGKPILHDVCRTGVVFQLSLLAMAEPLLS